MNLDIEQKLHNCSRDELVALVGKLYGIHSDTDIVIDTYLNTLAGNVEMSEEVEAFRRHLDSIIFENDFIDYRQAGPFARRLGTLLESTCNTLGEEDPRAALQLLDYFLSMADRLFEQADDSGGDIGMLFRETVGLWLDVAADIRNMGLDDETDWVARVLHFFDRNDYGCFDDIIANSDVLLDEEELRQMAWRFENDARKALKQPENPASYNHQAMHACIGLASVATALKDMALYEKSTLIHSPEPNALQMAAIVRFALEIHDYERARHWLDQPGWEQHAGEHTRLTNEMLKQQGHIGELKENLLRRFFEQADSDLLGTYWNLADSGEKEAIQPRVSALALKTGSLSQAVEMLLIVKNTAEAAQLLTDRADELSRQHYSRLTDWVEAFERAGLTLATVLCYRALLSDILDQGRSKAYRYAADYFHKLLQLDRQQPDYRHFCNAQQYIEQLQQVHWRKRLFWSKANHPNKSQ